MMVEMVGELAQAVGSGMAGVEPTAFYGDVRRSDEA
jgi:hypothetical protein